MGARGLGKRAANQSTVSPRLPTNKSAVFQVQDQRGDWVQSQELREYYQARLGQTGKTSNKQQSDSQNNLDTAPVSAVSDRNKKNADLSSENSDNNYTIPYGEKARNAEPSSRTEANNPSMFNKVEWGPSLQWSGIHRKTL